MLRFLFWLLVLYIGLKIVQAFVRKSRNRKQDRRPDRTNTSFDHIQDAEFEDVTDKPADKQ